MTNITFLKEIKRDGMGPPSGMCFDRNTLLLSDELHHRVEFFDLKSEESSFLGKEGSALGEFRYPKGICIDTDGCFYVADCWNHRVQKFSPDRKPLFSVGKYGDGPEEFNEPFSLKFSHDGRLFVVDRCNHRIQILDRDGGFHGSIGQRGTVFEENMAELYGTPLSLFSSPAFEFPNDLAFDSSGNMYVVDCNNHRIVKLDSSGTPLYFFGEKGSESGQFRFPHGITIDKNNLLFISDMNNERVQVFTPQGFALNSHAGQAVKKIECPTIMGINEFGDLYVASGLDSLLRIFEYESTAVADVFSNQLESTEEDSNWLPRGLFLLESENVASDLGFVKNQLVSLSGENICEKLASDSPRFYPLVTRVLEGSVFDLEDAQTFLKCLGDAIDWQVEKIKEHLKSRMEKGKDIVLRQLRYEEAALQKQEAFDTDLVRLQREDREEFRATRQSVLVYKRLIHLTRTLTNVYLNVSKGKGEGIISLTARNTRSLLEKMLLLLEEREFFESEREKYFKDESRNQSENWADFRYFSWCYDVIDQVVQVSQEATIQYFSRLNTILEERSPKEGVSFASEMLLELETETPLWKIVAKISLLSACDHEMYHPSFEDVLKEFLSNIFRGKVGTSLPDNDSGSNTSEDGILFSVFHILFAESDGVDSQLFKHRSFHTEERGDMSKIMVEISTEVDEAVAQCKKTIVEAAAMLSKLSGAPIKDESLRLPIANKVIIAKYLEILSIRSFVGAAMKIRLIGCELVENVLSEGAGSTKEGFQALLDAEEYLSKRVEACLEWSMDNHEVFAGVGAYKDGGEVLIRSSKLFAFNLIQKNSFRDVLTLFRATREKIDLSILLAHKNDVSQALMEKYAFSPQINRELVKHHKESSGPLCYERMFGRYGAKLGELNKPAGIALDTDGYIFVVEQGNHRVQKFSKKGEPICCFGSFGNAEEKFNTPFGIAIDEEQGLLYIGDTYNNRVQVFSKDGDFVKILKPDDGKGFNVPVGITINQSGVISVVDHMNHRIVQFAKDGTQMGIIGSEGKTPGEFFGPIGITVDSENRLYVGDVFNYRIQKLNADGSSLHCIGRKERGRAGVLYPCDLTIGPNGDLYVSDGVNAHIKCINKEFCSMERISEYGRRGGEVIQVAGITSDDSSLYLCDLYNHRIQQWTFV